LITAQEFKEKWNSELEEFEEGLVPLAEKSNYTSELTSEIVEFLVQAGLPDGAAPFLSFDSIGNKGLKKIFEIWGTSTDYTDVEKSRLTSYLVIGADGAGNPIAVDINNKYSIVVLDHEDGFNTIEFMNSSVRHLAKFLILIRKMVSEFIESGLSRDENDEIPVQLKQSLFKELSEIDPNAVKENGFWRTEIGML
jgi:hypothetical protein